MKLNRENFGVYVTLVLLGAGLGILVGSYLASKGTEDDEEDTFEKAAEALGKYSPKEARLDATLPAKSKVRQGGQERTGKGEGTIKNRKKSEPQGQTELEDELDRLANLFPVTQMQREMVTKGVVTVDELTNLLQQRQPQPYTGFYNASKAKPDLSEVVPSNTEGGYVSKEYPVEAHEYKRVEVVYFEDDDVWVRVLPNKQMQEIESPDLAFGDGITDEILTLYAVESTTPIYVIVDETQTVYAVEYLEGDSLSDWEEAYGEV